MQPKRSKKRSCPSARFSADIPVSLGKNAITQEVIEVTEKVCQKAKSVVEKIRDKGKLVVNQSKQKLTDSNVLTEKLLEQAKQVVAGNRVIPDRIVSFFDPETKIK